MRIAIGLLFLAGCVTPPPVQGPTFAARIDQEVVKISGYRDPTAICSDGEFLRRVMLDLVGVPPNAVEVRAFVSDPNPGKRAAKVDQLLATERYADFWARRWMAVFFGNYHVFRLEPLKSLPQEDADRIMAGFRAWLREHLKNDCSWSDIVQDLLEAEGKAAEAPPLAYKLGTMGWPRLPRYENRAAIHFLGIDLSCAGCHDHPFDNWRVENAYTLMSFSTGRTLRSGPRGLEVEEGPERKDRRISYPWQVGLKREEDPRPEFLHREKPAKGEILAKAFSRMMTDPKNGQFPKAAVNRVWAWLLGRELVNLAEGFNLKNKPLSPTLLALLADEFKASRYSFKSFIRGVCASDAYQRRCEAPGELPKVNYSRGVVRPLCAEQIVNSLETATLGRTTFDLAASQALAELMIRGDVPGCEVTEAAIDARALLWLENSERVWTLIRESPVLHEIRKTGAEPVGAMFLAALSREPDAEETQRYAAFLQGPDPNRLEEAYWTLLNSTEFLTRH
jgi:hypothetical protein